MASNPFRVTFLGFPLWLLSLVAFAAGSRLPALASTDSVMAGGEILWMQTYGGEGADGAFAVEPAGDGGFVFAGFHSAFWGSYTDVYLVKTDADGNELWSRTFGGPMNDYGAALARASDGGFAIAGQWEQNPQTFDAYLVRTDAQGNLLWERTYDRGDDERAHAVWPTSDGGFVLAGQAWELGPTFGSYDVWLIKTDADGNVEWDRLFALEAESSDVAVAVQETADGGFVIAGETQGSVWAVYLIRTDALGHALWQRTFNRGTVAGGRAIAQTADGGFVVAGDWVTPIGGTDVLLFKTDADGVPVWDHVYGGLDSDRANSVRRLPDGGFAVAGYGDSEDGSSWDAYLLRTDELGVELWSGTYGGAMDDRGWSVLPSADGHLLVAGWTYSSGAGQGDALLLMVADGDLFLDGFESGDTSAWSLALPSPLEVGPGRNRATRDRSRGESSR
jgi:hypothetical protein